MGPLIFESKKEGGGLICLLGDVADVAINWDFSHDRLNYRPNDENKAKCESWLKLLQETLDDAVKKFATVYSDERLPFEDNYPNSRRALIYKLHDVCMKYISAEPDVKDKHLQTLRTITRQYKDIYLPPGPPEVSMEYLESLSPEGRIAIGKFSNLR
jgi:hypothetical protein